MKKFMLYFFCTLILLACNSSEPSGKNEDLDKTFFPIAGTILSELKNIDSLPIAIIRYTTVGNSKDTVVFEKKDMRIVADQLIQPDISLPENKKYFKETVFMDNTTNTVTMSYTTESKEPSIRKIEVTINPDNQRVRSIYVEKLDQHDDSTLLRKMIWTTGKNLQVISLINKNSGGEIIKTEKYEWGNN
jgi:hypothetical protein